MLYFFFNLKSYFKDWLTVRFEENNVIMNVKAAIKEYLETSFTLMGKCHQH